MKLRIAIHLAMAALLVLLRMCKELLAILTLASCRAQVLRVAPWALRLILHTDIFWGYPALHEEVHV